MKTNNGRRKNWYTNKSEEGTHSLSLLRLAMAVAHDVFFGDTEVIFRLVDEQLHEASEFEFNFN